MSKLEMVWPREEGYAALRRLAFSRLGLEMMEGGGGRGRGGKLRFSWTSRAGV